MRRVLVVLGLALGLAAAAPALAQPAPEPPPMTTRHMRTPEHLNYAPSGFRLDGTPARGGAYRYRLMIVGLFSVMLTAGLVARYLRKINRARPSNPSSGSSTAPS